MLLIGGDMRFIRDILVLVLLFSFAHGCKNNYKAATNIRNINEKSKISEFQILLPEFNSFSFVSDDRSVGQLYCVRYKEARNSVTQINSNNVT